MKTTTPASVDAQQMGVEVTRTSFGFRTLPIPTLSGTMENSSQRDQSKNSIYLLVWLWKQETPEFFDCLITNN